MPAAFAVCGHAHAVSSWLNLVERLVIGADDQLAAAWHPIAASSSWRVDPRLGELCGAVLGRANRDPPNRRWPSAWSPSEDIGQMPTCS